MRRRPSTANGNKYAICAGFFNVQRRGLSAEMIMSNPITVGFSGLTNRIFAGRSKASKLAPGVREFTGEKFDVTDEALFAVAHLLAVRDDILIFPTADGKEIHLRADIKEKREAS